MFSLRMILASGVQKAVRIRKEAVFLYCSVTQYQLQMSTFNGNQVDDGVRYYYNTAFSHSISARCSSNRRQAGFESSLPRSLSLSRLMFTNASNTHISGPANFVHNGDTYNLGSRAESLDEGKIGTRQSVL